MDITILPTLVVWGAVIVGLLYGLWKIYIWYLTKGKKELEEAKLKMQNKQDKKIQSPISQKTIETVKIETYNPEEKEVKNENS